VIDIAGGEASGSVLLPAQPSTVAITPDGNIVYVTIPGSDSISVLDTETNLLVASIDVAAVPTGLAIDASSGAALPVPEPAGGLRIALLVAMAFVVRLRSGRVAAV
jgi:YVTN family beta-propeller protein